MKYPFVQPEPKPENLTLKYEANFFTVAFALMCRCFESSLVLKGFNRWSSAQGEGACIS